MTKMVVESRVNIVVSAEDKRYPKIVKENKGRVRKVKDKK